MTSLDERFRQARGLLRDGEHAAAIALASAVCAEAPHRAEAHHLLGRALERSGDLEAARDAFRDALAREGRRGAWHFHLANVLHQLGDLEGAAAAYQQAVDREPWHPAWHSRLGACRRKLGDFVGAAVAYQDAAVRDPDDERWWYWHGVCRERVRDWVGATAALRRADAIATRAGRTPPSRQLPYQRRVRLGLVPRPQYGYGILRACELAAKLGIEHITVIELGVAGGNGLVAMEENASAISAQTDVRVDVLGFDTGGGLYEPVDLRDMPHFFAAGAYAMDLPALEARLRSARLVLGDAAVTFGELLASEPPPIGFMSFDMDVYSATKGVLDHLGDGAADDRFLPRTTVYFDDVSGWQGQDYNPFAGELLAIEEFNAENTAVKLAADRTFHTFPNDEAWHHGTYTLHRFEHPRYATYVSPADARSLGLRTSG